MGESIVRVDHALLGLPGARVWKTCAGRTPIGRRCAVRGLPRDADRTVPEHDTAGAARKVAEAGDPADGAIASVDAAAVSGLIVLAERIQTEKENFTKFAIVGGSDRGSAPPIRRRW